MTKKTTVKKATKGVKTVTTIPVTTIPKGPKQPKFASLFVACNDDEGAYQDGWHAFTTREEAALFASETGTVYSGKDHSTLTGTSDCTPFKINGGGVQVGQSVWLCVNYHPKKAGRADWESRDPLSCAKVFKTFAAASAHGGEMVEVMLEAESRLNYDDEY